MLTWLYCVQEEEKRSNAVLKGFLTRCKEHKQKVYRIYIILMSIRMSYPWNLQESETVQEQLKVITMDLESMEVSMCSNHLNTSH